MSFSHREQRRADRQFDILTNDTGGLRIVVSRHGAELISLARRRPDGSSAGFLYRDNDLSTPASGWANHATVMGYYLHRLKGGRSSYRGREIRGGTHGFLRNTDWHADTSGVTNGELVYRVGPDDYQSSDYPVRVALDLIYRCNDRQLTVEFRFHNLESTLTAHVGFGLHPGFGATSFTSFEFMMPPGKYRRHFAPENFLSGETEDIDFCGGLMPFDREKLPGSFIIELVDVPDRQFVYRDSPSGRTVILTLADVPYLTLWSDGGPFLCVEPCWGLTDRHQQRAFENKDGAQIISPGGALEAQFIVQPELSAA
jgi:galactose mutarotase-like enzyme